MFCPLSAPLFCFFASPCQFHFLAQPSCLTPSSAGCLLPSLSTRNLPKTQPHNHHCSYGLGFAFPAIITGIFGPAQPLYATCWQDLSGWVVYFSQSSFLFSCPTTTTPTKKRPQQNHQAMNTLGFVTALPVMIRIGSKRVQVPLLPATILHHVLLPPRSNPNLAPTPHLAQPQAGGFVLSFVGFVVFTSAVDFVSPWGSFALFLWALFMMSLGPNITT